jgi:MoxR-like ATPase
MQNGTLEPDIMPRTVTIDDVTIHLRQPDTTDTRWIGQKEVFRLLSAAWMKMHENDRIMSPILIGPPGSGKTTLACAVAQTFQQPVYLINCTSDMRPEDLLITPLLSQDNRILYRASSLVSAMITGGVCVLDEANRMNEKSWASLASLLDDRRYIESITSGTKIPAHPEFRIVATMNDDSSTFNIPEYIESRLKPVIPVEFPQTEELKEIIALHMPFVTADLIAAVVQYLQEQKTKGALSNYSIRDAIQITRFAQKFPDDPSMTIESAAKKVLKIHESSHLSIGRVISFV